MLALVGGKGWTLQIKLLVEWSLQRGGNVWVRVVTGTVSLLHCVLRICILRCFMRPLAVAGLGLRYFAMPMAIGLGHHLRYPQQMAFKRVEILGLHKDCCANRMLLALFLMVCMKYAMFWGLCAWVLAQNQGQPTESWLCSYDGRSCTDCPGGGSIGP